MALHDHATVRVFAGHDQIDVSFPRDADLTAVMKKMGGRWVPDRRCWRILPERARKPASDILAEIENTLLEAAPPEWRASLPRISKIACATSRYEMKVGAGGIRFGLPQGHPSRWALKEIPGAKEDGESWLIPAQSCALPEMKPIIARVAKEDRELLFHEMQVAQRRGLAGVLALSDDEMAAIGLAPGAIVFGDRSFLRAGDPRLPSLPIVEMPFSVQAVDAGEDGLSARLDYPDPEKAYASLRGRVASPESERSKPLNMGHVLGEWRVVRAGR